MFGVGLHNNEMVSDSSLVDTVNGLGVGVDVGNGVAVALVADVSVVEAVLLLSLEDSRVASVKSNMATAAIIVANATRRLAPPTQRI